MPLTPKELELIEEGISLAVAAVLAAVKAANDQGSIDWNSLRITETPEMARARAGKNTVTSDE